MHTCLADLGSWLAGDPRYRRPVAAVAVAVEGLCLTTVNYRAPEVALGDRIYSFPVDCWPLGC
eukprot:9152027-Lingulodinium_polyedra.AAC.1